MNIRGEWMGDQVKGAVRRAVADGLLEGATEVIESSKKVAPRKTGRLRDSGYSDVDSNTLIAIAGYDDPRDIKTIKQHEDLSYHHPAGEQPKFLEGPLRAFGGAGLQRVLSKHLRRVFR